MATEVSICNEALTTLGQAHIASFTQAGSKNAAIMGTAYPHRRDYLLRSFIWRFAKKRVVLAPNSEVDPFAEWSYMFNLPSDFIRVVHTDKMMTGTYHLAGKYLYSNSDTIYLTYVRRVTDVNEFDPMFVMALAALIARDTSKTITGEISKLAVGQYDEYTTEARFVDSIEDDYQVIDQEDWELERL